MFFPLAIASPRNGNAGENILFGGLRKDGGGPKDEDHPWEARSK